MTENETIYAIRGAKLRRGILVNFNTTDIRGSIWTKVNGYDAPEQKTFLSVGEIFS